MLPRMYEKIFHSNQLCSGYTYELSTFRAKVYAYYALEENNECICLQIPGFLRVILHLKIKFNDISPDRTDSISYLSIFFHEGGKSFMIILEYMIPLIDMETYAWVGENYCIIHFSSQSYQRLSN